MSTNNVTGLIHGGLTLSWGKNELQIDLNLESKNN